MDKRISQLDAVTTLDVNDVLPIVNGGVTKKVSVSQLSAIAVGDASTIVREVKNMTGATLTKGTVVYISGANGNKALVSKALATTDALSSQTFGMLQSDILNNGLGNCVVIGDLTGVDTSSFAEGAQLYLSGVTAGAYTDQKILAPTHLVYVGKVTRVHPTLGQIEVGIQNGYELEEIHDVQIATPLNNQVLTYETSTDLWKNKTIATILGYSPYRFVQTSNTSNAGTTVEQIAFTATVAPNTFSSSDIIKVLFGANKTTVTAGYTLRLRINTSNTLTGSTIIATFSGTSTIFTAIMERNFHLIGGNLNGTNFTTSTITDVVSGTAVLNSTAVNPANQFFIFATIQLVNATEDMKANMISITN